MTDYNTQLIADLRSHGGTATLAPFTGAPLAILHTRGARSGEPRAHPLAFSRDGAAYVVVASKAGADTHPAWYHNLLANPDVEVEVEGRRFPARARALTGGDEYERIYAQHAEGRPAFWEYREKTSRRIPVVVLDPIG